VVVKEDKEMVHLLLLFFPLRALLLRRVHLLL
jgi:hypothetical protein